MFFKVSLLVCGKDAKGIGQRFPQVVCAHLDPDRHALVRITEWAIVVATKKTPHNWMYSNSG